MFMARCNHCHKYFKKGDGKGSLKTHMAAVKAANKKKLDTESKIKLEESNSKKLI